ncbi:helicase associated domain-containing protein [Streptomyces roseolus]|uniref:helicase associated domain-containing protein n=1 Tax=Streptomyces roseolus TaxID=67358 RepID=UPI00379275D6
MPSSPPARAPARPPRGRIERLLDDGEEHDHKLGIWYANTRQRRAHLNPAQRAALTALGVTWACPPVPARLRAQGPWGNQAVLRRPLPGSFS